ncbi:MerR family transcriptional regulator [uncultured Algimonas sp.]|uniref:MerR family transcriptional regulator n=1 Tax=uncultured Algimonas sp. TaxID=1547920 RepID=UPI002611588B|nr:MerR family transcriptional regulator [uncultured Algimonas sp.]
MRAKTTRAFRTISEAGDELGLQPHVLRFWESKFSQITPIKRGGGRRFYRPEDIEFLRGIKTLLHDEKHPIKDVQKLIAKSGSERIIELGRSVEQASRERDLTDMPLVPDRIETGQTPQVVQAAPPIVAEIVKPKPPVPEKPEASEPSDADVEGLESALSRLKSLRDSWTDFDTSG